MREQPFWNSPTCCHQNHMNETESLGCCDSLLALLDSRGYSFSCVSSLPSQRCDRERPGGEKMTSALEGVGVNGERERERRLLLQQQQQQQQEEEAEDDDSSSEEEISWIVWFINLRGNEFFAEVEEDYIHDDFNLTGLNAMVPYYDHALDLILDEDSEIDDMPEDKQEIVETAAEVLYGLIHARYILTNKGMLYMHEKFQSADFGRCPRTYCQGQPVLPVGLSDLPRNYSVNVFCPRCQEIYYPRSSKHANIDGAYFGTTFSNLFLLQYPDLIPPMPQQSYVPRVFGFRINKDSDFYKKRETGSPQGKKRVSSSKDRNDSTASAVTVTTATTKN